MRKGLKEGVFRGGEFPGLLSLKMMGIDLAATIIPSLLNLLGLAAGFGFHVLMARRYGAVAVGHYGLMLSALQIMMLVAIFGTNRSVIRFVAASCGRGEGIPSLRPVWLLVLPLTILFALILAWRSQWLAVIVFDAPGLSDYLRYAALILVFAVPASVWAAAHQGCHRTALAVTLREVIPLCVAFAGLWLLGAVWQLPTLTALVYSAGWLVAALAGGLLWIRGGREEGKRSRSSFSFHDVVSMSWPMLLTSASFLVLGWTDTIMLGMYHDSATVGVYRVALKISVVVTLGAQSLRKLAGPRLAAAFAGHDQESFSRWLRLGAWGNAILVLPVALPVMLAPSFFLAFFGPDFQVGRIALLLLCGAEIIRSLFGLPGLLLEMTGFQACYRNAMTLAALLNVVLNFWLVPRFGPAGAAGATALSCTLGTMLASAFVYRRLHVNSTVFSTQDDHRNEFNKG